MKRPFWLDFVCILAIFLPPVAAATAVTYGVARKFGVSASTLLAVYLAAIAVALVLWTVILTILSKLTRPRGRAGLKGDDAGPA